MCTSGDKAACAAGQLSVGVAFSDSAEEALPGYISVNGRLCVAKPQGSVDDREDSDVKHSSAYAETVALMHRRTSFMTLATLVRRSKGSTIVIIDDLNAQVRKLSTSKARLGDSWALLTDSTDNGDIVSQFGEDNRLFLSSTNYQHSTSRIVTWRSDHKFVLLRFSPEQTRLGAQGLSDQNTRTSYGQKLSNELRISKNSNV